MGRKYLWGRKASLERRKWKIAEYQRKYYYNNREKRAEYMKERKSKWTQEERDKYNEYQREYHKNRKMYIKELEKRVAELERVVKELIHYKEDIEIMHCDSSWKPIARDIHDYNY